MVIPVDVQNQPLSLHDRSVKHSISKPKENRGSRQNHNREGHKQTEPATPFSTTPDPGMNDPSRAIPECWIVRLGPHWAEVPVARLE